MAQYHAADGPIPAKRRAKLPPKRKQFPLLVPLFGSAPRHAPRDAPRRAAKVVSMRLSAVDLACRRGGREVFAGIAFGLGGGQALAVTGRNGAGKSSLLRIVAGLLSPAGGRLWLEGGDPELTIAEQAHYLGHQDAMKPSLTVSENLQFWTGFFDGGAIKVQEVLESVGLGGIAALPAGYLSAGQRRRLSIARLLAVKRPIWLLDEPASTLDAAGRERLTAFMQSHLAGGGLILAATHGALGLSAAQELSLDGKNPSPFASGWGGGPRANVGAVAQSLGLSTPTPDPSSQGGGK
jgi:heme exporter protein A